MQWDIFLTFRCLQFVVRNEEFQKSENVFNENNLVTNNLDVLLPVLARRLVDSNGEVSAASIAISQFLGNAEGMQCKPHVPTLLTGVLLGIGDTKPWIRTECGFKEFFDGEMIADAHKSSNTALIVEQWARFTEKTSTLPPKNVSEDGIFMFVAVVYKFEGSKCRRQKQCSGSCSFIYDALTIHRVS
jgi:cytoskeleton-associated protein 5